jgi:hypothetical protein
MSSSLKSGNLIVFVLAAMLFIFLSCVSAPPNPYDFSNTKINLTFKSSSDQTAIDTLADTVGKTVQVGITSNFPSYVDSIEITVFNSANGHVDIDTILKQLLPLKNGDTLWYQTAFAVSGKRTIMGTVYAEGNNKYSTKGFIITIIDEPAKPVLRAWPHLVVNKAINITPSQTCSLAVLALDSNTTQAHTFSMKQDAQPQVEFTPPFIWVPPSGFIGTSLVFFKVTDTDSPSYFDTATVTITVSATPINHAPHWQNKTLNEETSPGNAINLTLSTMCKDSDNDPLTFTLLDGAPSNDSIANAATAPTYTFLPGPGDTGTLYPKIVVTDSKGGFDTMTITLNIHAQSISSKALTAFSFTSPAVAGTINESAKTVALTVPYGTDVTALVATFASTGASVKVGTTVQTSGTTPNNFTSPVTYTVIGTDGSTQAYVVTVTVASNAAKALTAFSFSSPAITGTINESAKTVAVTVPNGTDVTTLVATFAVSSGASVKVGSTAQTSGTTANNFTSPVTYTVVAADGSTQAYVVTVTIASNTAKALTAFSFTSPAVTGTINESAKTVALIAPFGTDVTALVATFASTGASVKVGTTTQTSGTTANNFTSPVTYTVVAADGSTQAYVVTVTIAPNTSKALTAFSFTSPVATGTINESAKTAVVSLPFGTDVTALVATFASTGASVKVGSTAQTSGTTANNFTSPVTYTVVAADGSTQAYVVTVTVGQNTAKALTGFSFTNPAASGTITESSKTVAVSVPFGTDVTALVATFVSTGASVKVGTVVQTSGTTPNNFTSPVTYTVVAADGSTQAYVVTVTVGANTAKTLTSFSFASPAVSGTITESAKTVALTVPFGTDVTALKATFVSTGASVKVGAVVQTSGTTPNTFTSPVTYTVVADDGGTQAYVVTVTIGANTAIIIASQPSDQTKCIGSPVSFSVSANTAAGTLSYQWKNASGNLTEGHFVGTTTNSLSISAVATGDAGTYSCYITSTGGGSPVTSSGAKLTVNTLSSTPTLAANVASVCPPGSVIFTITGTLGTGANWQVYAGSTKLSTQPTIASNSFTISNISAAASYLVKAEGGTCDNASSPPTSNSVAIAINQPSTTPTLAANVTSVCAPGSVIFTITGILGTGAQWQVYAGSTKLSTQPTIASNSFTISNISAATSYSVKAEGGTCDNASSPPTSNSIAIAINQPSTTPTLAANNTNVCSGGNVTFTITGGALGTGANWAVFAGGTRLSSQPAITNNSFTISNIIAPNTYSVQAENGACINGIASNGVSITLKQSSSAPTLVVASNSSASVCPGGSVIFTISGGVLGTGANWAVFAGGTRMASQPVISSNSFTILNITAATSYTVQAENGSCNNGTASNAIPITLNKPSSAPSLVIAANSSSSVCPPGSVTFNITGGTLGTGANWAVFAGGTRMASQPVISNNSFTILNITAATSYTVQAENGFCNNGNASNPVLISIVHPPSISLKSIMNQSAAINASASISVSASGTAPLVFQWYRENQSISNSNDSTLRINSVTCNDQGSYYCEVTDKCGNIASTNTTYASLTVKCQLHYDRNGATIVYVMTPDSVADCGSSGAISTAATGGMKNVLDANGNVIGHQNCIGWSTDPNATTPIVSSNFYVVDNLTLYMVWGAPY